MDVGAAAVGGLQEAVAALVPLRDHALGAVLLGLDQLAREHRLQWCLLKVRLRRDCWQGPASHVCCSPLARVPRILSDRAVHGLALLQIAADSLGVVHVCPAAIGDEDETKAAGVPLYDHALNPLNVGRHAARHLRKERRQLVLRSGQCSGLWHHGGLPLHV